MKIFKYLFLALSLFIGACKVSKPTEQNANTTEAEVSYKKSILPIIESKCSISGCHVQGFYEGDFTLFEEVKKQVDRGKFRRLVIDNKSMPPDEPLNPKDIKLIDTWLKQGGNNN
ncbi:MAG TPA: hypothetical protein PK323_04195 [Bacteroidia bacterium]|nr:hypothetical protein [Bacteroidia bacterium]